MQSRALLLGCVLLVVLGPGCAQRMSERATQGVLSSLDERAQQQSPDEPRPIEIAAGRAVDAALAHLTAPEQVLAIRRVVASASGDAASAFQSALVQGLTRDLGPEGQGPLARSLAASVGTAAAAATDHALSRVLAECGPGEQQCLDRRVSEISEQAAAGLVRGLSRSIGVGIWVVAFLAGAAFATIVMAVIALVRRHHAAAAPVGPEPDWVPRPR